MELLQLISVVLFQVFKTTYLIFTMLFSIAFFLGVISFMPYFIITLPFFLMASCGAYNDIFSRL